MGNPPAKEYWPIEKLRNWEQNPRTISEKNFERLKAQIKELGEYKPLLVCPDGEVIGGNMRLRAYRELGFKECWVSVVNPKDEAEKLKYALSDNDRVGQYDEDSLANLLGNFEDVDLSNFSVDLKEPTNIQDLLDQFKEVVEDEAPEVEEGEPVSKLGEIYQLGRHRLMCGDATKIEDVERLMDGKKADMVFTDPPYGLGGYGGRTMDGIMGDDQDCKQFYDAVFSLAPFLNQYEMYIWGNYKNLRYHLLDDPRDVIVWVKNNFGLGAGYRGQYELCFYYGDFRGSDSDVWQVSKDSSYVHPTQKPIELITRAIKNSNPQSVLDIYGGSGSTLIACEQTNRTCYMMELDPKYVDVIRRRYAKFIGKEEEWQTITPKIS